MQFKISAAAVLAYVASTIAQTTGFDSVYAPDAWETIEAGKTFKVEWQVPDAYKGKTVSLSLIGGETQGTQVPLIDIASGISNDAGAYDWAVPADLGEAKVYGLVIKLSDDASVFQYSNPFKIDGPAEAEPTTQATSTAPYGVKTVSLSTAVNQYTTIAPVNDYTTVVPVVNTVTVPCNGTAVTAVTPPPYTAPAQPTGPVVPVSYSNATWTTSCIVPPATTNGGSYPGGSTPTPAPETPVTGAGARFGAGSFAVVGGLLIAALAL
ncbi:Ser-Thr-rich glycosyl-phosphatidyl-inositol-anchored membrane family-domain-containing protein [Thelonectria olida]|uniref:Ser-Thr-rich glycosyl-phosphatidyl-inositol-anchored membrane family-domain-containing protein n=1 Tax=Thelonectria olida TaxID=1576542 RepID=A0A9P8WGC5_9HYPO|nr:Ser-Thr-rich glycosyl-phosphatidyl-inositol-anchored membrane family-domain-containing protein [Thelonectria olida]